MFARKMPAKGPMALPRVMDSIKYPMPSPLALGGTTLVMTVAMVVEHTP